MYEKENPGSTVSLACNWLCTLHFSNLEHYKSHRSIRAMLVKCHGELQVFKSQAVLREVTELH